MQRLRNNTLYAMGAVLVVVILGAIWLGVTYKENVDVVRGVPPVSRAMQNIQPTLIAMKSMPTADRAAYLTRNWPHLSEDVTYYLRQHNRIRHDQAVERTMFYYGSLDNVSVESNGGAQRYGYFGDQLVALVKVVGVERPIQVLVECLNGTFIELDRIKGLQAVGDHTPIEQFTIARGEGLIHHVDFPVAIDLAERHKLPLYRGKVMTEVNKITPMQARALEATTDRLQVTVRVTEGDQFDLRAGTYTRAPRT